MIEYVGRISRKEVNELYGNSRIGILLYQPAENHFKSQPIKLFEYMAAGLPVIASNFELWKEIIEKNDCGVCVDCTNPECVKKAIQGLINDTEKLKIMGDNGRRAVENKFNWKNEEKKLIELYSHL